MSAGVWAYPTWFTETSCITAMEAQAAGLHIVTSPIAALNETVGPRGKMISGDWLSKEYHDAFVDEVVKALKKPSSRHRKAVMKYAREHFSWDNVVQSWDDMFKSDMNSPPLPKYKSPNT